MEQMPEATHFYSRILGPRACLAYLLAWFQFAVCYFPLSKSGAFVNMASVLCKRRRVHWSVRSRTCTQIVPRQGFCSEARFLNHGPGPAGAWNRAVS